MRLWAGVLWATWTVGPEEGVREASGTLDDFMFPAPLPGCMTGVWSQTLSSYRP